MCGMVCGIMRGDTDTDRISDQWHDRKRESGDYRGEWRVHAQMLDCVLCVCVSLYVLCVCD